ncbi:MAG: hypothetical protein E6Q37_02080 [Crocinitomicaceae bacterium]|nr:MAG: hypothetical protein E6Q37_02080 [Crocinitomicaceae bacterium]
MEKFVRALFSMRMMALAMLVFLVAIGAATMLESIYDIQTAKIIVYNALWFEILLVYLCFNLIANIVRYRMFQREKIAMLTFHISFIVIIIGAGITRHFSSEGLMLIREGESSNFIYAADPHVYIKINDGKMQTVPFNEKMLMSEQTNNYFDYDVLFPKHPNPVKIEYVDFKKKQIDTLLIHDTIQTGVLDIVTGGMNSTYVSPAGFVMIGDVALSYDKKDAMPGIMITKVAGKLMIESKLPMRYLPMSAMQKFRQLGVNPPDSLYQTVPTDSLVPFLATTLYQVNDQQFVFKREIPHAKMVKMSSGKKNVGVDVLTLKITDGSQSMTVDLEGGMGQIPTRKFFSFNGLVYEMEYGSTRIELPFSVLCRDFQLDKYPGSDVASSFASEVTIQDPVNKYTRNQRIFMNNVMDYNGYRFFQSAYDLDDPNTPENEEGTRLSVNQDWWGTNVTYLGYLLMSIGMILSIFAPTGRFKELLGKLKKSGERRQAALTVTLVLSLSLGLSANAQEDASHEGHDHATHAHSMDDGHDHSGHNHSMDDGHDHAAHAQSNDQQRKMAPEVRKKPVFRMISEAHSDELASLLVQDFKGRIVPFHTMCNELLVKVHGKRTYKGNNSVQTVLSMHMYPDYWIEQQLINVPKAVREGLKLGEYVSFKEMINEQGEIKFLDQYNAAHQKLESKRSEFEKKIIKLVERHQVMQSIFSWQYMKLIPLKGDPNKTWYVPLNIDLMQKDTVSSRFALKYLEAVNNASISKSYGLATDQLNALKKMQRDVAADVVPTETHVNMEIRYNKMNIFKNAMYSYFVIGSFLLIIFFIRIFVEPTYNSERRFKKWSLPFVVLMVIVFVYHGAGLGMRWYISGHAPWSNGYEAVIFIAWVTMIAGFLFSRKNPVVLAGTAILAFFMIFVTEMNLLDPEITPLQPVLKSYWLMIHVAIITGSYGFLGLGAILGLINQSLYVFRNKVNAKRFTSHINEITYVSELTITIGLFMLTIGTFLGGIWANESWGRYWGWDPKETWALVSVLVYAVILHLRYIPALSNKFLFNIVSFWGFTSILFTFFGVNFYLVGLHSYANGEGLGDVPMWIFWTAFGFYVFSEIAALRYQQFKTDFAIPMRHFTRKLIVSVGILYLICGLQLLFLKMEWDVNTVVNYSLVALLMIVVQLSMLVISKLTAVNSPN